MKRLGLTFLVLAILSVTTYYVLTHENIDRAQRLEAEVEKLRQQNRALADENKEMNKKVVALRDDPRLAERRARASSRLARPGEVIFQFGEPDQELTVHVLLEVGGDSLTLAGETLLLDQLNDGLAQLTNDVPNASLQVSFDQGVDALREQQVRDLVDQSPLAPAEYLNEQNDAE